ncbi:MAG: hypothetical protein HYU41_27025 [Candidatus Rokubacteria bacterium]|nr:hypothetical protein [Candidatus Rokubacteria bacterium]
MSQPAALQCEDHSGFLFSHPCDRLATGQCVTCGKAICVEHTRLTETGPRCVSCLRHEQWQHDSEHTTTATTTSEPETTEPAAPARAGAFGGGGATQAWSAEQAMAAGDDPHFVGGPAAWQAQYDAEDHAAFEAPAAAAEAFDTDIESDTGAS